MKAIALTLCLCLLLGVFAFGNPQAAYGWTPSEQAQERCYGKLIVGPE